MASIPTLERSTNRKTANKVTPKGKPSIANAFGLPAGLSCPGQTDACGGVCYAAKIERIYKGASRRVQRNWDTLQACGEDVPMITRLLADMVADFVRECTRKGAPLMFRIHWDGDFYSRAYAQAWRDVILAHPEVTFWAYTRTWDACRVLGKERPSNLNLYVSEDADNQTMARAMARTYGLPVASLAMTKADAVATKRAATARTYLCPATTGALKGDGDKGSACAQCRVCVDGRGSVIFVKH